jgi:hypothetical protein
MQQSFSSRNLHVIQDSDRLCGGRLAGMGILRLIDARLQVGRRRELERHKTGPHALRSCKLPHPSDGNLVNDERPHSIKTPQRRAPLVARHFREAIRNELHVPLSFEVRSQRPLRTNNTPCLFIPEEARVMTTIQNELQGIETRIVARESISAQVDQPTEVVRLGLVRTR